MNKFRSLLLTLLTVFCLFSCHDDEVNQAPAIVNEYIGTMANNTSVVLEAKLDEATKETAKHQWLINGELVGNDYRYTFAPVKSGKYTITYIINNGTETFRKDFNIIVKEYIGGFYIVNEGWFGHDNGSVNYFDVQNQKLTTNIHKLNNEGRGLGVTTCYATLWDGKYYFVSKQGRRLIAVDQLTFKDTDSLRELNDGDGRGFAGVNESTGVVTTSNGAYVVSLNPLKIGPVLEKTTYEEDGDLYGHQCGGVYATKDYVFVIAQGEGILIYDVKNNFKLVKEYPKGQVGFTCSKDGSLWAAEGETLIRIDAKTLDIKEIALESGYGVNDNWRAWNPGSLCASPKTNVLYFTKGGPWGGGNQICRYSIDNNKCEIFAKSTVASDDFYGRGINVDPSNGNIVATFVEKGWGEHFKENTLVIFSGTDGSEIYRFKYNDTFWFPIMILFN